MVLPRNVRSLLIILSALCFTIPFGAHAAKVAKVDGKKVMLFLQGDSAKPDDVFVLIDGAGKKKGLVKIKAVKGDKAVGFLGKGKAESGWAARMAEKSKGSSSGQASSTRRSRKSSAGSEGGGSRAFWGMLAGVGMDSMSVDIDNDGDNTPDKTVELKGMGFSAKGLFDYQLFDQIWFRGTFGLEGLSTSGSSEAGCQASTCKVNVYYLSADFWARYLFSLGSFRPWVGGGFTLMFPATKKATALEESSITNTSVLSVGFGFDWWTSPTLYFPVQIEYGMLPKSETVEASIISFRLGLAVPF